MVAIQPSVIAAFFEPGALNAPTPFEIASVPVIATHPSAKPRRMRNVSANPTGVDNPLCAAETASTRAGAEATAASRPNNPRVIPVTMSASIIAMKTYVGTLNAIPESRTPRKLTAIKTMMTATQRGHRVRFERRVRGRDRRDAARDRHRNGEDVVGEKRRGGDQPGHLSEVVLRHRVRAAALRIRENRLPVGQGDQHEQQRDHAGNRYHVRQRRVPSTASTSRIWSVA